MRLQRFARLLRNIVHTRTFGFSEDEEYRADLDPRVDKSPGQPALVIDDPEFAAPERDPDDVV